MKTNPKRPTAIDCQLGKLIRARRKAIGMSQTDLGDKSGIAFQQVQKYENGVNRMSVGRLVKIAEALDLKPSQIMRKIAA